MPSEHRTNTTPDRIRSVEYLRYLAQSHPGKYDQDIKACCEWAAWKIMELEMAVQVVVDAVKKNPSLDILPCRTCGQVIVTIPDGLPLCDICGKKEEAEA